MKRSVDSSFSRIPLIYILSWCTEGRREGRRRRRGLRKRSRIVKGWSRDISRLYARPTPNFAELPYDSIYPILPVFPPALPFTIPPCHSSRNRYTRSRGKLTPLPAGRETTYQRTTRRENSNYHAN